MSRIATICRKVHFNAAHRLHHTGWTDAQNEAVFGKCNNPNYHGHNYTLIVKVTGKIDPKTGFVRDIKQLKELIETQVVQKFDHKNLNLDTAEFERLNSTVENIARVIYDLLLPGIGEDQRLAIELYETEKNYVEYHG